MSPTNSNVVQATLRVWPRKRESGHLGESEQIPFIALSAEGISGYGDFQYWDNNEEESTLIRKFHKFEHDPNTLEKLGHALWNRLANSRGTLSTALDNLRNEVNRVGPLQLTLEFVPGTEQFASLPWELLNDNVIDHNHTNKGFFFNAKNSTLNRVFADATSTPFDLHHRNNPPLVLFVWSNSEQEAEITQEVGQALATLKAVEKNKHIQVEELSEVTIEGLEEALSRWNPDIVHIVAHGWRDEEGGSGIILRGEHNLDNRVNADRLARTFTGKESIIVLCTCKSGITTRAMNPGVGQRLLISSATKTAKLGYVIAMQSDFPTNCIVSFTQSFYTSLSNQFCPKQALAESRAALPDLIWGMPVLFARPISRQSTQDANSTHIPNSLTTEDGTVTMKSGEALSYTFDPNVGYQDANQDSKQFETAWQLYPTASGVAISPQDVYLVLNNWETLRKHAVQIQIQAIAPLLWTLKSCLKNDPVSSTLVDGILSVANSIFEKNIDWYCNELARDVPQQYHELPFIRQLIGLKNCNGVLKSELEKLSSFPMVSKSSLKPSFRMIDLINDWLETIVVTSDRNISYCLESFDPSVCSPRESK